MEQSRQYRLLNNASGVGCNAVAAFEPENVFYLTGFWGEGIAVCMKDKMFLIVPKLEASRAENETGGKCEVIRTERGMDMISTIVQFIGDKIICIDSTRYFTIEYLRKKFGDHIIVNDDPFFQTRKIKDESEINKISKSAKILDRLYQICCERIRVGISERQLQAELVYEAMKLGSNPPSYKWTLNPLIIAGGPNGALPHAEVSDREFCNGDLIVVDLTLRHDGYIADATRTFALGRISDEAKKVYDIVKSSQQAGIDSLHGTITCEEVDTACRKLIEKEGYGANFIHSTGHGIGLDVHEPPWIRTGNKEILEPKMAITIEPGIYLENRFGIRIEDSVIIGSDGMAKSLNSFKKELIEL